MKDMKDALLKSFPKQPVMSPAQYNNLMPVAVKQAVKAGILVAVTLDQWSHIQGRLNELDHQISGMRWATMTDEARARALKDGATVVESAVNHQHWMQQNKDYIKLRETSAEQARRIETLSADLQQRSREFEELGRRITELDRQLVEQQRRHDADQKQQRTIIGQLRRVSHDLVDRVANGEPTIAERFRLPNPFQPG